jgi:hypothetical protein
MEMYSQQIITRASWLSSGYYLGIVNLSRKFHV